MISENIHFSDFLIKVARAGDGTTTPAAGLLITKNVKLFESMCVRDRKDWEALKNEANDVKELFTYARWLSINAPLTRLSISYG